MSCRVARAALFAVTLSLGAAASAEEAPLGPPPRERGIALGLFSMDDGYRYRALLEEVKAAGATHVSLCWVWWQDDLRATRIHPVKAWSATDEQIAQTIADARALGLHVTAFPILRLVRVKPGDWRGRIRPEDEDAWWQSYTEFILHAARLSREHGAERLAIGSELLSREHQRARWVELAGRVRAAAPSLELLYSANWDHFEAVSFWDAVDVVGVTGYWELTRSLEPAPSELEAAWKPVKRTLREWSRRLGRPFVFSEIGYPSLDGGAAWPWNDQRSAPVDLDEQRMAYGAFVTAWAGTPELAGVYWWNWFGFGGPADGSYTPRSKPAAELLRAWYAQPTTSSGGRALASPAAPSGKERGGMPQR